MLEQVLTYLNNWFPVLIRTGTFTVYFGDGYVDLLDEDGNRVFTSDGKQIQILSADNQIETITLPFLQEGQYFRIIGSLFNDGLYKFAAGEDIDLHVEQFDGAVWSLGIPKQVVKLAEEIAAWQEKHGDVAMNPYQSESFGGYSYSKRGSSDAPVTWQSVFKTQLAAWRKI